MNILKKIAEWFKGIFPCNKCRFSNNCKGYQRNSLVCNSLHERFTGVGYSRCKIYRGIRRK